MVDASEPLSKLPANRHAQLASSGAHGDRFSTAVQSLVLKQFSVTGPEHGVELMRNAEWFVVRSADKSDLVQMLDVVYAMRKARWQ